MNSKNLANTYTQIGLESAVLGANQQQLTTLLLQGLLNALARAKIFMAKGAIPAKGKMISQAIAILETGLIQALAPFTQDPLAAQLTALFHYLIEQLMLANLSNDVEKLSHCQALLQEITHAWQQSLGVTGGGIDAGR